MKMSLLVVNPKEGRLPFSPVSTLVRQGRCVWNLSSPGIKPMSLLWQEDSYPLYHQGSLLQVW